MSARITMFFIIHKTKYPFINTTTSHSIPFNQNIHFLIISVISSINDVVSRIISVVL